MNKSFNLLFQFLPLLRRRAVSSATSSSSSVGKDPYKILEVPRNASQADIKRAYKRKAFQCHPDMGGSDQGKEFLRISEAYKILETPASRRDFELNEQQFENSTSSTAYRSAASDRQNPSYSRHQYRPPSEYELRAEEYRRTGKGENKPIYGSHYSVLAAILFVAVISGGGIVILLNAKRLDLIKAQNNMHFEALAFEEAAKKRRRKVSTIKIEEEGEERELGKTEPLLGE